MPVRAFATGPTARRLASLLTMFAGALVGSFLVVNAGGIAVVAGGSVVLAAIALVAARRSRALARAQ